MHAGHTRTHTGHSQARTYGHCQTLAHTLGAHVNGQYSATPNTGCDDTRALGPTHS